MLLTFLVAMIKYLTKATDGIKYYFGPCIKETQPIMLTQAEQQECESAVKKQREMNASVLVKVKVPFPHFYFLIPQPVAWCGSHSE